jgi:hypothetical protein
MLLLPPFVGIAIVVLSLKNSSPIWGSRRSFLDAIILGSVVGALFGVVFRIFTTQPTGFDFVGFWDGRELPVMYFASVGSMARGGLFGAVAATLIWSVARIRHDV